jgi:hypothetical protein
MAPPPALVEMVASERLALAGRPVGRDELIGPGAPTLFSRLL